MKGFDPLQMLTIVLIWQFVMKSYSLQTF